MPSASRPSSHPRRSGRRRRRRGTRRSSGAAATTAAVLGPLGVEHPQRVAGQGLACASDSSASVGLEVSPHRFGVAGTVVVLTEGVEQQSDLAQPEALEEPPGQGDDLDVEIGVVAAEGLDPDLVEGPVAALLGTFVAEVGPRVEHLPGQQRLVLHEGPHHPGGHLGTQGDPGAVAIGEVVHLLGDHVGGLAHPQEHPQVLQQRRDDLAVAGPLGRARRSDRRASRRRAESGHSTSRMPVRVWKRSRGLPVTATHATGALRTSPVKQARPGSRERLSGAATRPASAPGVSRSSSCQW